MKYLIVGLGNIGEEYRNTRHNIGFMVLDALAKASNIVFKDGRYGATSTLSIKGRQILLLKPSTYMNLSGESVRELTDYYKVSEEEIIVIYDDISLDVGQLRIRAKGSAGGHNGIKNIIQHLGSEKFPRIKVGVGDKPKNWDLADYVLSRFPAEEQEAVEEGKNMAADACVKIMQEGITAAMNLYNQKKKKD